MEVEADAHAEAETETERRRSQAKTGVRADAKAQAAAELRVEAILTAEAGTIGTSDPIEWLAAIHTPFRPTRLSRKAKLPAKKMTTTCYSHVF